MCHPLLKSVIIVVFGLQANVSACCLSEGQAQGSRPTNDHKSLRGRSSLFVCSLVKGNRTVLVNKVFAVFDSLILVQ